MGTLAEASLTGGTPRQLLEKVFGADWSPDGKELAVTREVEGKPQLEFPIGRVLHKGGSRAFEPSGLSGRNGRRVCRNGAR